MNRTLLKFSKNLKVSLKNFGGTGRGRPLGNGFSSYN